MSLHPPPRALEARVWTTVPAALRKSTAYHDWGAANRPGLAVDCFLEGPSFDRSGALYVVDVPFGRIFRIDESGAWDQVAAYDGWPNGLKIHRDGRIFITDYKFGIMQLDAQTGSVTPTLTHLRSEGFKGVNDLFFAADGTLYFTDQGQTGMHDPTGRVYHHDFASGRTERLLANGPSPNGLVTNPAGTVLYVAMTRGNAVWRVPLFEAGGTSKVSIFTPMAGGNSGADGMAVDVEGNLYVCDAGQGCVWSFSPDAVPLLRIAAPNTGGRSCTNCAFGGVDNAQLFITESDTGNVLVADIGIPGAPMYSHSDAPDRV
ncbi:MAG: SMP-30/gluconolactonase/LRE family protein [Pseudomonadota bacterium]